MKHELKMSSEYFKVAWAGDKPFEIRFNDRDFEERDEIVLQEYEKSPDPCYVGTYTGREIHGIITYVTNYEQKPGYVVFGYRESRREEE